MLSFEHSQNEIVTLTRVDAAQQSCSEGGVFGRVFSSLKRGFESVLRTVDSAIAHTGEFLGLSFRRDSLARTEQITGHLARETAERISWRAELAAQAGDEKLLAQMVQLSDVHYVAQAAKVQFLWPHADFINRDSAPRGIFTKTVESYLEDKLLEANANLSANIHAVLGALDDLAVAHSTLDALELADASIPTWIKGGAKDSGYQKRVVAPLRSELERLTSVFDLTKITALTDTVEPGLSWMETQRVLHELSKINVQEISLLAARIRNVEERDLSKLVEVSSLAEHLSDPIVLMEGLPTNAAKSLADIVGQEAAVRLEMGYAAMIGVIAESDDSVSTDADSLLARARFCISGTAYLNEIIRNVSSEVRDLEALQLQEITVLDGIMESFIYRFEESVASQSKFESVQDFEEQLDAFFFELDTAAYEVTLMAQRLSEGRSSIATLYSRGATSEEVARLDTLLERARDEAFVKISGTAGSNEAIDTDQWSEMTRTFVTEVAYLDNELSFDQEKRAFSKGHHDFNLDCLQVRSRLNVILPHLPEPDYTDLENGPRAILESAVNRCLSFARQANGEDSKIYLSNARVILDAFEELVQIDNWYQQELEHCIEKTGDLPIFNQVLWIQVWRISQVLTPTSLNSDTKYIEGELAEAILDIREMIDETLNVARRFAEVRSAQERTQKNVNAGETIIEIHDAMETSVKLLKDAFSNQMFSYERFLEVTDLPLILLEEVEYALAA